MKFIWFLLLFFTFQNALLNRAFSQDLPSGCLNFNQDYLKSICLAGWGYQHFPKNSDPFQGLEASPYTSHMLFVAYTYFQSLHQAESLNSLDKQADSSNLTLKESAIKKALESAIQLHQNDHLLNLEEISEIEDLISSKTSETKSIFTALITLNAIQRYKFAPAPKTGIRALYNYYLNTLLPESDQAIRVAFLTGATSKTLFTDTVTDDLPIEAILAMKKSEIAAHFGFKSFIHGTDLSYITDIIKNGFIGKGAINKDGLYYVSLVKEETIENPYGGSAFYLSPSLLDEMTFHASSTWKTHGGVSPEWSITSKNTNLEFYHFLKSLNPNENEFVFYRPIPTDAVKRIDFKYYFENCCLEKSNSNVDTVRSQLQDLSDIITLRVRKCSFSCKRCQSGTQLQE